MMVRKWDLKVCMACLAALRRCTSEGTSWYQTFPLSTKGGLEFGADFVVEDLEVNIVPTVGLAGHDKVVGGQSVSDLLT